jgi:protein TonB
VSQAARAQGSLPGLFSNDDYPPSALSRGEQGTTAVSLTVGPDGRVSGCSVTSSSGSTSLDSTTCSILKRRARFTPAKDQNGSPISDTASTRVKWVLPED